MLKAKVAMKWGICFLVIATMLIAVSSCKKSENGDNGQTPAQSSAGNVVEAELVPIPLELPKPMFVGTPGSFAGIDNLEKPLGKPRDDFLAPEGTVNVAAGKPVTSTDDLPIIGELDFITDGDKEASDGSYVQLAPGIQSVTIDLGAVHDIYAIVIWHYHKQGRVYRDVIVQVANDADFTDNVQTVFNNDMDNSVGLGIGEDMHYVETAEGKLIDCLSQKSKGRYVRCYSNGNNSNDCNDYIEVEVFGKPAR
jgi:hypothetical protein